MNPQPPYPVINRLIGKDLRLAQYRPNQAAMLAALVDKNRTRLRKRLYWVDRQTKVAHSQDFIMAATRIQRENGAPTAGIWAGPVLIGTVSLHPINWETRTALLGYWLDGDYERQGIMTKAVTTLCNFAFKDLGLKRLEIVCAPDNIPSQAIAVKLGFERQPGTKHAVWKDDPTAEMVVFAKLAP